MKSSMEKWRSALQFGHLTRSVPARGIWASPSQALHLKCIIGAMKALFAILCVAVTVQAQSLADFARHERERQAHLKPAQVITGTGSGATVPAGQSAPQKTNEPKKTEEPKKAAVDPVREYNDQVDKLRAKIRSLQDEEAATQLRLSEFNNQVYAPVVDQAAKDDALAVVAAAQMKLADIRKELADTRKTLEALETQGPPKR